MKIFRKEVDSKCPGCNWDVSFQYTIATNKEEAEKIFKNEESLCAACLLDMITDTGYNIYQPIESMDYINTIENENKKEHIFSINNHMDIKIIEEHGTYQIDNESVDNIKDIFGNVINYILSKCIYQLKERNNTKEMNAHRSTTHHL